MSAASQLPPIGSAWQNTSGSTYVVLHIANNHADGRLRCALTVVCRDRDGLVWTCPVDDWHRTMTMWPEPPP